MVFTMMTILYLPLGFVAVSLPPSDQFHCNFPTSHCALANFHTKTLYGIDLFDFALPSQKTSFTITTIVVSVATYAAAVILLYGVRERRRNGSIRQRAKDVSPFKFRRQNSEGMAEVDMDEFVRARTDPGSVKARLGRFRFPFRGDMGGAH